jgi:hypothetical protein
VVRRQLRIRDVVLVGALATGGLAGALPASLVAQDTVPFELLGERVRLRTREGLPTVVGQLTSLTPDSLRVTGRSGAPRTLAYSDITSWERSNGYVDRTMKGMFGGFWIGLGAGTLVGVATLDEFAGIGSLLGGVAGGFIGLAVGCARSGDDWEAVEVSVRGGPLLRSSVRR